MTALLCRQGEVQSIFDASLAADKDGTGKALVTNALGVLAKEPLVARIVERLTERVNAIFTPTEKFTKSADSPLVRLQEQLKMKEERLRDLKDADIKGKAIEERVVTLQAERLQLLDQTQAAEAAWRATSGRDSRATARANLQNVIDDCTRSLTVSDGLISELDLLQANLVNALVTLDVLREERGVVAAQLKATQDLLQAAAEEVARASATEVQSGQMAAAALHQRRAELEGRKVSIEALLKDVASAERSIADRSSLDRDLHDWTVKAEEAPDLIVAAQRALEQATLSEKLRDLAEKEPRAERFLATYESARSKEAEAAGSLATAEQALTASIARRDGPDSGTHPEMHLAQAELDILRAVEVRLKAQSLRDQVADLQAHEGRAIRSREAAFANRSKASQIEQEVAGRVLPTKEQIASWRKLEVDLAQRRAPAAPMRSPLLPLLAGVATGLIVALVARLAVAASALVTMLAAVTASIVVGISIWTVLRNKARSDSADHEGSRRLSERWALEVLPSLREARLPELSAYEGAVAEIERRRTEAQQLRFEAEKDDLQALAASQTAAPLEGRRAELAVLESQLPPGGVAADIATVEESGANLPAVRQRIEDGERRLESLGPQPWRQDVFDSYRNKYENVRMKREDGILEVALHSGGGPLVFNGHVHEALVKAFRDIGDDPENHVVILTGTGDEFCAQITPEGFDFFTPTGFDKIFREGTKILENLLDIQVPMIAAINGPVTVHSEYALLCDIVIATDDAYFQDAPHPAFGIVPGDGLHVVWPEVIGEIRGRYFLLTGQKLSAAQAKEYGAVNEVLSREALLPRAWELARHMNKQSALTLRYTRMALSTRFRRRLQEGLSYGLALEGISAAQVAWLNAQKAKG